MARGEKRDAAVHGLALAALDAGSSPDSVAKDFKLPVSTVKHWNKKRKEEIAARKERLGKITGDLADSALIQARRTAGALATEGLDHDDLVTRYRLVGMEALCNQFELFQDLNYLKKFNPADIAFLHGIIFDKLMRLMEAHERGAESLGDDGDDGEE